MVRTNVRKMWFVCFTVWLLIMANGLTFALPAHAEEAKLKLQIEPALNGQAKGDKWFPVQFTITNEGSDISGELAVTLPAPNGGKDVMYTAAVDLPRQTAKTVTIALPGMTLHKNNNKVEFYKGKAENGKKVAFAGDSAYIDAAQLPFGTAQIGVVARDPDTMSFLGLLNQKGYQVKTLPLQIGNIPSQSMLLDSIDVLVFNDTASDQLKDEQIKAIEGWVKRGGMLIIAGGAGYPKTAAPFGAISPVVYSGTESVTDLSALVKASGKELSLAEPFTLSKAELKDGKAVLSEGTLPIFASKPLGNGEVWYAAYDLALNPLASWNGNTTLWETILADHVKQSFANKYSNGFWEINNALEDFEAFKLPSFGILLLVILIYAAVIGPLMYAVLRKLDKREWAWVTIPLAAVLFTAGIYVVGASGRSSTMSQSFSMIKLDGGGEGKKTSVASIFVPRGGSFNLEIPGSAYVSPLLGDAGFRISGGSGLRGSADMVVTKAADHTDVTYKDVSYWSIRKAWIDFEKPEAFGKLEADVRITANGIEGNVANRTNGDLTDVTVYAGGQIFTLPSLKAGETAPVKAASTFSWGVASGNLIDLGNIIYPYQGGPRDENSKKRALLSTYLQTAIERDVSSFILGWSGTGGSKLYTVDGKTVNTDELTLWIQAIDIDPRSGSSVFVPAGMLKPQVVSTTSQLAADPMGNVTVSKGETIIEYRLPEIAGAVYGQIKSINNIEADSVAEYTIWNADKETWEPLEQAPLAQEDAFASYIANGRSIKIKIEVKQNEAHMRYPEFAVEGTVKS
ncbi:DUF7408 domain-containing protein [Paenibacillus contaminans]|uniref:DUF7408 domain-containing protein n=1 Tax=Paenibacillus contaminans TaxID=450362 RepID=A0A329MSS5_9BACL|nr:hypothetical protein [Paenibacillus contaminans]RAV21733.1 hypothetical protein DQG23_06620 [Paenibacillus contaminans]